MVKLIDGKAFASKIKEQVKEEVAKLDAKLGLAVVLVGEDPASELYVGMKVKTCADLGIQSYMHKLDKDVSQEELLSLIDKLNKDDKVNGILVQMPIPQQIDRNTVMKAVLPIKDVDGFHPENIGKLVLREDCLKSCTPRGVVKLIKEYDIDLVGKDIVIIGRSVIVGTPLSLMLLNENATVTVCHSKTKDIASYTKKADIVISAVGRPNLVTADMVKDGVVIIDIGTNKVDDKLVGDVDFDNIKEKCSYITPVPGGVGPMTIACLMENTLTAYKMQVGK